jgi:hypothetical protein
MTRLRDYRLIAAAMSFAAATLALMSSLHLSGILDGGGRPFDRTHAGIAEAVICVVLSIGSAILWRGSARSVAIAATAFAIAGFAVGLNFTIRGGSTIDVAYHATVLPLLLLIVTALVRPPARRPGPARSRRSRRSYRD